jgi:uncharacterized protein YjiS (DUF1127 family)
MASSQHAATALPCPHPAHGSIGRKAANLARRAWARYWARRAAHATVAVLHSLDDRALKDIGLDRSEIESVVYSERRARVGEASRQRAKGGRAQVSERRVGLC